jgi:predicted membrane-bound mannosyltransferase
MSSLDLSPTTASANAAPASTTRTTGVWLLTLEQLAYIGLGIVALFAHLWMLGDRALHHDETLHASYSWFLYVGRGYIHDPLLHGPLLYYIGALNYFLFGDNDFTARLGAGLAGSLLTLTPYLVRREIGRGAALLAAVYLLISPVALYVGRFIRHDIYSMVCEMLVFAAIVRYVSTRQAGWLYVGIAAFALMFVNQETSYLFLVIMSAPLIAAFLWRVWRPGLLIVGALALAAVLLTFVLPGKAEVDGNNTALRDPQTGEMRHTPGPIFGWRPLETDDNSFALRIRNRPDDAGGQGLLVNLVQYLNEIGAFFGHPAVLMGLGLALGAGMGLYWGIWRRIGSDDRTAWERAQDRGDPAARVVASLVVGQRWVVALLIFLGIYALFFTAFFSNILGLITGTTGSLLYWLAQHNVERGGQPGHYYAVILLIYEPLLILWSTVGYGLIALRLWRTRQADPGTSLDERGVPFAVLLLAWWSLAAFGIYTWAGEKMPWLTIHISVPMTLFSAWSFAQAVGDVRRLFAQANPATGMPHWAPVAIFGSLFASIIGLGFITLTAIVGFGAQSPLPPWAVPAFAIPLLALLTIGAGLRWNWGGALALLAICITVALSLGTARAAYRLAFQNGDVPREMMVYTQTSPDVMHVMRNLEEASIRRGRGLAMPVLYDNETVWTWYLRRFTNGTRVGPELIAPPEPDVMAVLMLQENFDRYPQNRVYLNGFVVQRYPLRWWFPEDQMYRLNSNWRDVPLENTSLIGQVLRAPFDPDVGARLWRFLINRDLPASLGSTDFVIAVRPELANQIGPGFGGELVR